MKLSTARRVFVSIVLLVLFALIGLIVVAFPTSCTSNHYFSINAEEITNPQIEYHDSTSVYNPF